MHFTKTYLIVYKIVLMLPKYDDKCALTYKDR